MAGMTAYTNMKPSAENPLGIYEIPREMSRLAAAVSSCETAVGELIKRLDGLLSHPDANEVGVPQAVESLPRSEHGQQLHSARQNVEHLTGRIQNLLRDLAI